jgi:hypothetical protein
MTENEERKIEGRWWIAGPQGAEYFGTLTSSPKTLELVINVPQNLTLGETMRQAIGDWDAVPKVIVGRTAQNEPITLFGCSTFQHSISAGLRTLRIDAIAGIEGLELSAWNQTAIRTVNIDIDPLCIWLGGQAVAWIKDGEEKSCTLPDATDLSFKVSDDVEFGIWCSTGISSGQEKVSFRQGSSAWLQFDQPRSLQQVCDNWLPWVDRLFSLLIGSAVRHGVVTCHEQKYFGKNSKPLGKKGQLIRMGGKAATRASEISWPAMITRYSELSAELGEIVGKWADVADRYEPLVDILGMTIFNRSLHAEAQFLFLLQALEVYHARCPEFDSMLVPPVTHKARVKRATASIPEDLKEWAERTLKAANNKHLDERLSEIFNRHRSETDKILGADPALAEKIRYTRNHLTHHTGDDSSSKLLKGTEIMQITWNLRTFIWVCLLKEIGVSGVPIDRLIRKYEARFVSLD